MSVSAVVFDLGGVLTESPMTAFEAEAAAAGHRVEAVRVLEALRGELLGMFDAVVESSTEGVRKPEPEIYRRALARLSDAVGRPIAAPDCAYLDDLGVNLRPARALGFATVKVVDPDVALAELSSLVGFSLEDVA